MTTTTPIEIQINASANGQGAVDGMSDSVDRLGREAAQTGQQTETASQGVDGFGKKSGESAKAIDGVNTASTLAGGAIKAFGAILASVFAEQIVQAIVNSENLAMGLNAIAQNSQVAGEQLEFVRRMAMSAGVDVVETGKAFLSLQASTKGTAVEGKATSEVFEAVTVSMAKAGKSSAETGLALQALGQMAGKGVVSMEELRGQLGEALPGAMQAAANGFGITVADLTRLVESGKVAAEDIFPALTKGLKGLYGTAPEAQTLGAEITNLKNEFTKLAESIGEAGATTALKVGFESAQIAIIGVEQYLLSTQKALGLLAYSVKNMEFGNIKTEIEEIEKTAQDRFLKAAQHNSVLKAALMQTEQGAKALADASKNAGDAVGKAGDAAAGASKSYTGITNAYEKLYEELDRYIGTAKQEVELAKATGDAAVAKAQLLGDEEAARKAVAESAAAQAAALVTLAERQQAEVDAIRAELEEKRRLLAAEGPISEQRQKQLKELEDLIVKKQVEAATTAQQAAKAQDHAKSVSEANTALRKAVADTEALTAVKRTEAQTNIMGLETQLKLAQSAENLARVMGDEAGVRKAKIAQMEIEIQLTKAKAEVQRIEAEGAIAVAQAKRAELEATNQLTPLKAAEIDASIKLAQAKIAEAQAIGASTGAAEKMLERIKNGTVDFEKFGNAGAGAFGQIAAGAATANAALQQQQDHLDLMMTKYQQSYQYSERQIELLNKQAEATEKLAEAERKRLNIDKEGFSLNTAGQRVEIAVQTAESIRRQLVESGVGEAQAVSMADRLAREYQQLANPESRMLGAMAYAQGSGRRNMTWDQIMRQEIADAGKTIGGTPTRTVNVNLTMGGKKVNANIPQGQERTFLDMLAADKGASL